MREPLGVEAPTLAVRREWREPAHHRQVGEFHRDGGLEMVTRNGLMERRRLGLCAVAFGRLMGVREVDAGTAAVNRRLCVIRAGRAGSLVVGDRAHLASLARQT